MDRLLHMQIFCQIIDSGSMAEAARTLGLAPATVTGALARLERKLGIRLLDRTTRRINATEAGRLWYEHAKQILEASAEAENAVRNLAAEPRGALRVTLPLGLAMLFVYPCLQEFSRQYPLIDLDLQVNDRTVDLVENRFDVALRVGALKDADLIARPLLRYRRPICASPAYLNTHGTPLHPDELSGHQCLLYQHDQQPVYWDFWINERVQKFKVNGRLKSNESHALLTWARAGMGITRQPDWMVENDLRSGTLIPILEDYVLTRPAELSGIYAVLPRARNYPAKVEAFLAFLSQKITSKRSH